MAALAALIYMGYASPARALPSCSSTISNCGCTADTAAVYTTNGDLSSSSGDCIDVTVSGAVLVLAGNITGSGSASSADGIHVMSAATDVFIEGVSSNTGFTPHTISGFGTGIQADASGVTIDGINANDNAQNGIALTNASNCMIGDSNAKGNTATGILVDGGSNNVMSNDEADSNSNGFELTGGSGNVLNDGGSSMNSNYGTWIKASDGNAIKDSGGAKNATAIYIGCAASNGPTGKSCAPSASPANHNRIQESGVDSNTVNGIGIDKGDSLNRVILTSAAGDNVWDFVDKNIGCDHNVWLVASGPAIKKKPGCIHFLP